MLFDPERSNDRPRHDEVDARDARRDARGDARGDARAPASVRRSRRLFPALRFAFVTFVPLALLRGVIPYTRLVHFGPFGATRIATGATAAALARDVTFASLLSLAEMTVALVALLLSYASLGRVLGDRTRTIFALRTVFAHAYLLPLAGHPFVPCVRFGILWCLATWVGPGENASYELFAFILGCLPLVPLARSLHSNARQRLRVDALSAIGLTLGAVVFAALAGDIVHLALRHLSLLPF